VQYVDQPFDVLVVVEEISGDAEAFRFFGDEDLLLC